MTLPGDMMKLLWKEADEQRNRRIETAVEEMLTDDQARGVRVIENYFGGLIDVRLDHAVPFGTILIVRKTNFLDDLDPIIIKNVGVSDVGTVPPSEGSGGKP